MAKIQHAVLPAENIEAWAEIYESMRPGYLTRHYSHLINQSELDPQSQIERDQGKVLSPVPQRRSPV